MGKQACTQEICLSFVQNLATTHNSWARAMISSAEERKTQTFPPEKGSDLYNSFFNYISGFFLVTSHNSIIVALCVWNPSVGCYCCCERVFESFRFGMSSSAFSCPDGPEWTSSEPMVRNGVEKAKKKAKRDFIYSNFYYFMWPFDDDVDGDGDRWMLRVPWERGQQGERRRRGAMRQGSGKRRKPVCDVMLCAFPASWNCDLLRFHNVFCFFFCFANWQLQGMAVQRELLRGPFWLIQIEIILCFCVIVSWFWKVKHPGKHVAIMDAGEMTKQQLVLWYWWFLMLCRCAKEVFNRTIFLKTRSNWYIYQSNTLC